MDYQRLKTLDAEQSAAMTLEEAAAYWQGPVTRPLPCYINYRTLLAVMLDPARLEALRAAVKAQWPTVDDMLAHVGNRDGSAGGLDVSLPATQAQLSGFVAAGLLAAAEAAELVALGTETVSRAIAAGLGSDPQPAQFRRVRS